MGVFQNINIDNTLATDVEFRTWCQAFEAALLASGFLEAAPDTGQLDLTTVTRPAANGFAGYKMYRAKDSLAATKPLYVKIEFGLATGTTNGPTVRRTAATGSNGAGTLTGPTQTSSTVVAPTTAGSSEQQLIGSGGAHSAWVLTWDPSASTQCSFWFIGRLINPTDGSATDPIIIDFFANSLGSTLYVVSYTDGVAGWNSPSNQLASFFPQVSDGIHSGGNANNAALFQGVVYRNGATLVFPFLIGRPGELPYTVPDDSKFSLSIWGGSHTFVPIPFGALSPGSQRFAVLWE
jgi:hypothetical protein